MWKCKIQNMTAMHMIKWSV